MKELLLFLVVACALTQTHAQYVYKIKADSVLITNDSCTAELNLENSTKNVKGFLYNKGNGRTEFRKGLFKLNDSLYQSGGDTMNFNFFRQGGNTFGAMGILGTNDNYPMIFRQNGQPFLSTYGNRNILMGDFARLFDATIDENVLIGAETYFGTKRVQRNVAIGSNVFDSAGNWRDPAYGNVVIGRTNGRFIKNDFNMAIGAGALTDYNDSIGFWGVGSYGANIAIGLWSLEHLKKGNSNIGIGFEAGNNVDGNGNIFLGWWSGLSADQTINHNYSNVIMIGNQINWETPPVTMANTTIIGGRRIATSLSNVFILGGTYPAPQNILIGRYTVDSGEKLQVEGSGLFTQTLKAGGAGSGALQIMNSYTPSSSSDAAGSTGTIAWDENYIYIKTASGWKRSALTTF